MFMLFNDACVGGLGKDHPQFLGAQCVTGIAAKPKCTKYGRAGFIEGPDNRSGHACKHLHWPSHDDGYSLGRNERKLLGDQLANHQGCVGRDADNDPETQSFSPFRANAPKCDALGNWPAQRRPGISTGDNTNKCNADLHGG